MQKLSLSLSKFYACSMKVTLIISTYDAPRYLECVLKSLLVQTRMPEEILIADDGSGQETRAVIDQYRLLFSSPVEHLWQENKGFRKSRILNWAFATAKGDYILVLDGDLIVDKHYIADQLRFARPGYFSYASRMMLPEKITQLLLSSRAAIVPYRVRCGTINAILLPFITPLYLSLTAKKIQRKTLRGGIMAAWRSDLIAVNGYDEAFEGWGYEDTDLGIRLQNSGLKMQHLKFCAVSYHMDHGGSNRIKSKQEAKNKTLAQKSHQKRLIRCENGLDKWLKKSILMSLNLASD